MPTLPFIQNINLPVPMAQPDYSFLSGSVQKANALYEQGLAEIQSDYSAILNSDVTDQANIAKKQEYIKQFQEGLKKMADSDVSLPSTQAKAESLMAPFWQDNLLLKDIGYTKYKKAAIQKGLAAKYSKDEDIRKTFDEDSVELLQRQLNHLKTADRDENNYSALEWDDWTPVTSVQETLEDHRVKDKFEVVTEMRDQAGTIIKTTNGPGSISNYKVYGESIVGRQFNNQYLMKGKLAKERQIDTYMHMGMNREQATAQVATEEYGRVLGSFDNRISAFKDTIQQRKKDLQDLNIQISRQGGKPDPVQNSRKHQLELELQNYEAIQGQVESRYSDFTSESGKRGFMMQPETGIAQRFQQEDIDKWAYGMSQDVKVEIKKDDAFWSGQQIGIERGRLWETGRHNRVDEGIAQQNANTASYKAQLDAMELGFKYSGTLGTGVAPGGTYSGKGINEIYSPDPTEAANAKREEVHNQIYGTVYNPSGLSGILYKMPNANVNDINNFTEFMSKFYSGAIEPVKDAKGNLQYKGATNEQIASYWKIANYLHDQTGVNTGNIAGAHTAMLSYTARYIENHTKNGSADSREVENIRGLYIPLKSKIDQMTKDDNQRKDNLAKWMQSRDAADYRQYVVPDANGPRTITSEDIAKELQPITVTDKKGQQVTLSPAVIARAYSSGQLGSTGDKGNTLVIGDESYTLPQQFNQFATTPLQNVINRYGTPSEFRSKINLINNKVIPGTEFYNSANNIVGGKFTYNLEGDIEPRNKALLRETVAPGNYTTMYTPSSSGGAPKEVSPGEQQSIINILNNPKYKEYVGTAYNHYITGFNGKPMTEVTVNSELPKDAPDVLKNLKGKSLMVELSPTATGTYINQFPKVQDYSFHPLNRGQSVSSDPIESTTGQGSYSIVPYPKYNPTQYTITMTKNMVSNETGKPESVTTTVTAPAGSTNPEKLVQDVRGVLMTNGSNYYQNLNIFRQKINSK